MIDLKAQASKVLAGLRRLYPKAHCELDFSNPFELVVATILSAQCTDRRVNAVTPALFQRYPTARAMAEAEPAELEKLIRSTGFYRAKARSITEMSRALVDRYKGGVPKIMDELLTLRGVARKTANVVLGTAYGLAEGIVVDTHMKRVAYRLGLTDHEDPVKIELDLMACVPRMEWIYFGHAMIWHGRRLCHAPAPECSKCPLAGVCPRRGVKKSA